MFLSNWADRLTRQGQLWFQVILNVLLLGIFLVDRSFWRGSRNPAVTLLMLSYILPHDFSLREMYSGDDGGIPDERDLLIQKRGREAGFLLMSLEVVLILILSVIEPFPFVSALLVLWLSSRILTGSVQYAFMPDMKPGGPIVSKNG